MRLRKGWGIKRQLQSDQRKVQSFATETATKYSNLLRAKIHRLVDQGIVDGDPLTNAFANLQSQYATEAMDEVYEKFAAIWEKLKSKLEELDDVLQQEDLHSPEAGAFNKAQAFKWEKGMDASVQNRRRHWSCHSVCCNRWTGWVCRCFGHWVGR